MVCSGCRLGREKSNSRYWARIASVRLRELPGLRLEYSDAVELTALLTIRESRRNIFKRSSQPAFTLPGSLSANGFFSNLRHCLYIFIHYSIKAVSCQLLKMYKSLQIYTPFMCEKRILPSRNISSLRRRQSPIDFRLCLLYSGIITMN